MTIFMHGYVIYTYVCAFNGIFDELLIYDVQFEIRQKSQAILSKQTTHYIHVYIILNQYLGWYIHYEMFLGYEKYNIITTDTFHLTAKVFQNILFVSQTTLYKKKY